jgi:hypothetical protein
LIIFYLNLSTAKSTFSLMEPVPKKGKSKVTADGAYIFILNSWRSLKRAAPVLNLRYAGGPLVSLSME